MAYDAVVFDSDGVLCELTPRETLRAAVRQTLAAHGVTDPPAETVDQLLSTTRPDLLDLCETLGVPDASAFWADRDRHAAAAQRAAVERGEKGLYDDVDAVLDLPVPFAVVSNNQQATVSFVLEHAGVAHQFDPVIGRAPTLEDVARKKPSPHHVRRAVAALSAERPLLVGDSNVDLAAAEAAGVDSAFVRRDHRAGYELAYEPTHELTSLRGLAPLVDGGRPTGCD
jgi:phosphoglycolate phosphatase-like HAD superfamily hydrolase